MHDVVVVGASAGGVESLMSLAAALPAALPAAVLVVLHIPPDAPSTLARILDRVGPLDARAARDGEAISHGRIYVGVPNHHLLVHEGRARVVVGPRENGFRPSVDVLFRSAARDLGRRVVGVVLSGMLSDGMLGLSAIKLRGGVTAVQDPDEALFPGMPRAALRAETVDYSLGVRDIAALIERLARAPGKGGAVSGSDGDDDVRTIHAQDEPAPEGGAERSPKRANAASGLTCPECHGALWELGAERGEEGVRYECRVGHAYAPEALIAEQGDAVEAALWTAINMLQERAATFQRLLRTSTDERVTARFAHRAEDTERHAAVLHGLLGQLLSRGDVG